MQALKATATIEEVGLGANGIGDPGTQALIPRMTTTIDYSILKTDTNTNNTNTKQHT